MSETRPSSEGEADTEPPVPEEVIEAIDSLAEGKTANKDEIEAALDF